MSSLVTLAQIALYAQIRRPTVSNWRRRHPDFPAPISGAGTQPQFDADEVAAWLDDRPIRSADSDRAQEATTYGDVFRHGLRSAAPDHGIDAATFLRNALEMLAARTVSGQALPDDNESSSVAQIVDRLLTDLGPADAAEQIYAIATRMGWPGARTETPEVICDLITELVPGLCAAWGNLTVTDLAAGTGRLTARITDAGAEAVSYAESDPEKASLLRLRLACHGVNAQQAGATSDVVVADPPFQPGEHDASADHPLRWAVTAASQLTDDGYGFVVVPQWTLNRTGDLPVVKVRETLLRDGHLHAIIQLPSRIYPHLAGSDFALLVLRRAGNGPRRTVTICDANKIRSNYGDAWPKETARIVTGPGSERAKPPCIDLPSAQLNQASSLIPTHLLTPRASSDLRVSRAKQSRAAVVRTFEDDQSEVLELLNAITFRPSSTEVRHTTIGELLGAGQLIHLRGHRIATPAICDTGQRVIGREELLGHLPIGRRRVDLMHLAGHNAASLTEPGDVILLADEQLKIVVDDDGGSVLIFPAQGLRVPGHRRHTGTFRDEPQKPWIGPYALSALLRAARNATRTSGSFVRRSGLRQMQLPHLADRDRDRLDELLYRLHEATQQARDRVAALELLQDRIGDGIADGAFTLDSPEQSTRRGR